jgi:flavin reductase (DIM6/NTAB) family NADH-FMN oxidoreductase RutF
MPIEIADFKRALGQFATGVTVVTTKGAQGGPLGLTVSAFASVSLEPPLVLVSIDNRSEVHDGFEATGKFAVSVLAEDQEEVSQRFAFGTHKFDASLVLGAHGMYLVPGALAHIECRVGAAHVAGDHTIYVGEVLWLEARPGRPLVYHAGRYAALGAPA